ncbi:hypothetical protein NUU61_008171 [Penicillium alfredii]|uniref:NYN domain-containing protein n=1 Tax=Penicillium alfredii TaxID=1506179 RepID=A0A9W9JYR7_9EURO|nr:uncharacterized protein NUU61_008171 [Penicillium alfredii]KAJ5086864.1 hypothetical protein NUU61_008171 [Penicillium alfredii]
MLATESAESSSNWDFTPVLDLLRSPTYSGASPPLGVRPSKSTVPTPCPEGQLGEDVGDSVGSRTRDVNSQRSYPRLGDFSSLWDLLERVPAPATETAMQHRPSVSQPTAGPPPAVAILKRSSQGGASTVHSPTELSSHTPPKPIPISDTSKPRLSTDTITGRSSRPYAQPEAITILKRASDHQATSKDSTVEFNSPRTPTKPIPGRDGSEDTPRAKPKSRAGGKNTQIQHSKEALSSESSAEPDSDSNTVIFDPPISKKSGALAFVPSQLGTSDAKLSHYETPPSSYDELDSALNSDTIKSFKASGTTRVRPTVYKSASERRVGLMTKLLTDFPEYAKLVSQVGRAGVSPKSSVNSRPIHVFVDMSNIMVGFHDSVKVSRNIPITTRIRRLHISYSNFSLIMERGRPATKRVLVGSDRLPSIDEAETLGYEANILDRVHKLKHATPRPPKTRNGGLGGPETVQASGERWVEQGVDEILHLKILESLLDTDEPATIVLATGDAAAAEYSGGFMRMVERALQRGWIVELVSFSQVTSYAYRKKEFRAKWGGHFRMIELDAYIEELFD